jgi:hypothetical protein
MKGGKKGDLKKSEKSEKVRIVKKVRNVGL